MADAGTSFRGRGNGVNPGASGGNARSFGQDYKAYWAEQERRAEERASQRKEARERQEENRRRDEDKKREEDRKREDDRRERENERSEERARKREERAFNRRYNINSKIYDVVDSQNTPQESPVTRILNQILNEEKKQTSSISAGVLIAGLVRDISGLISRAPSASTGLDLLSSSLQIQGTAVGAASGWIVGQSAIGAQFGKEAGAFYGSALTREVQTKTALAKASAQYRALSGEEYGSPDLTMFGMDNIQGAGLAGSLAKASSRSVSGSDLITTVASKKIADLDDALILAMEKQSRVTGARFAGRSGQLLGIANRLGIRAGLYADMFSQSSSLTDLAASTGSAVNINAINQTMFGLNNIGGPFAIGSPTGASNQQALSKGVSNPGSPLAQAIMYNIMRKKNPNADFFDLQVAQENAANDPTILKEFLSQMSLSGGKNAALDKSLVYNNFAQFGMSKTSAKWLVERGFNPDTTDGTMSTADMVGRASDLTPKLEKQAAEVTNAFTVSFTEGIDTIKEQWIDQMKAANVLIASQWKEVASEVLGLRKEEVVERYFDNDPAKYNQFADSVKAMGRKK